MVSKKGAYIGIGVILIGLLIVVILYGVDSSIFDFLAQSNNAPPSGYVAKVTKVADSSEVTPAATPSAQVSTTV